MEPSSTLDNKLITDLKIRLALLDKVIREAQAARDPRWEEAARQQRVINKVLVKKIKEARRQAGIPEPEPVNIGMRAAKIRGRAPTGAK